MPSYCFRPCGANKGKNQKTKYFNQQIPINILSGV